MTDIKDLETRIEGAEDVIVVLNDEIAELKTHLQELKKQEPEQESLLGRWATHQTRGRGIIIYDKPDEEGDVRFAHRIEGEGGTSWPLVRLADLTLDPAPLTTADDFDKAPVGTIVEAAKYPKDVAVKTEDGWYRAGGMHAIAVEYMPSCRVIRWGNGK